MKLCAKAIDEKRLLFNTEAMKHKKKPWR